MDTILQFQDNIDKSTSKEHSHFAMSSQHPQPSELLLRSAEVNSGPITFVRESPPFTQTFNQPLASVTLDTSSFRKAKILIKFIGNLTETSNYIFSLTVPTGMLTFTLFKSCKKSSIRQIVASYTINYSNLSGYSRSRALDLEYFTRDEQGEECCTYTLELTTISDAGNINSNYFFTGVFSAFAIGAHC